MEIVPFVHPKGFVTLSPQAGLDNSNNFDSEGQESLHKIEQIMLKSRRDDWRNFKRHQMGFRELMQWRHHRRQHVMQDEFGNNIPSQRVGCWLSAPRCYNTKFKKDAGIAPGLRSTFREPASVSRPPPLACQRLILGTPAGGRCKISDRPAFVGNTGGLLGAGGIPGRTVPISRLPPVRLISVSVCSAVLLSPPYSQYGTTLCPEGAVTNW